jgi:hypothetical protein
MARRLNACDHLIGRDFGYRNTAALSVVRRTREITASELERIAAFGKKSAEAYLSGHGIDRSDTGALEVIETSLHDGSDFLGRIAAHSRRIDGYRSDINCGYERVGRIRALLLPLLGLGSGGRIPEDADKASGLEPRALRLVTRFFQILASIRRLKVKRREAYAAIAGIKKSWYALRPLALVAGLALNPGNGTGRKIRGGGDPGGPGCRRPREGNAGVQGAHLR